MFKELNFIVRGLTILSRLIEYKFYPSSFIRKGVLAYKQASSPGINFAQEYINLTKEKLSNILCAGESKIVLLDGTGCRQYVRRNWNREHKIQYTNQAIKYVAAK